MMEIPIPEKICLYIETGPKEKTKARLCNIEILI